MKYRLQSVQRWLLHRRFKRSWCELQVRKVAEENGVDVSTQIAELEMRAQQVLLLLQAGKAPCWAGTRAYLSAIQGYLQS